MAAVARAWVAEARAMAEAAEQAWREAWVATGAADPAMVEATNRHGLEAVAATGAAMETAELVAMGKEVE